MSKSIHVVKLIDNKIINLLESGFNTDEVSKQILNITQNMITSLKKSEIDLSILIPIIANGDSNIEDLDIPTRVKYIYLYSKFAEIRISDLTWVDRKSIELNKDKLTTFKLLKLKEKLQNGTI